MQVAAIYDAGRAGTEFIDGLSEKFGEPVGNQNGEVLWKVEEPKALILELLENTGELIFSFFVGTDDQDMTQYLSV